METKCWLLTKICLLKCFFSDITVSFSNRKIKAHKFVLAARSDHWSTKDLNEMTELHLPGKIDGKSYQTLPERIFKLG